MKAIGLKVGDKASKRPAFKVPLQIAESASDATALAKNNEAVLVRCFNRGWRIENQERSGARDAFKAGKSEAEIAAVVAGYDPTKVSERTFGPRKPKTVTLPKGKKNFTADDLKALLEAQGIVVADEGAAPAPAKA